MTTTNTVELDGQYRLLREEAGWVERADRGMLRVKGGDSAEFLQGQLTNDIEALGPNEGCYAALLDRKGHMQADMRVLRLEGEQDDTNGGLGPGYLIDTEAIATAAVHRHLDMYKIGRDVELEDVSAEQAITSLLGPAASARSGAPPLSPEYSHRHFERAGIGLLAVATDLGIDLISRASDRDALHALLAGDGVAPVSIEAAEILRVEAGRPRFGTEMSAATIPQEAEINERAVSFTKGCYIGQETVARLHYKGKPNRHLRGLRLTATASAGDPVSIDGREIGSLGTSVLSPALGPIALAILRREASPGDQVTVGDAASATVVELPFVP